MKDEILVAKDNIENYSPSTYNSMRYDDLSIRQTINALPKKKLIVNVHDSIVMLNAENIAYIKADGNYSLIVTLTNRKIICSKSLSHYCKKLEQTNLFFRVHHGYLVNISIISEWHSDDGLILDHVNVNVPVSRRNKGKLKKMIQQMSL